MRCDLTICSEVPAVDSFQLRRQNGRYTSLMNCSNVYTGFAIRVTPLLISLSIADKADSASALDICEQRPSTLDRRLPSSHQAATHTR